LHTNDLRKLKAVENYFGHETEEVRWRKYRKDRADSTVLWTSQVPSLIMIILLNYYIITQERINYRLVN